MKLEGLKKLIKEELAKALNKSTPHNRTKPASVKENQPMVEPTIKEPAIKEPERKKRRSLSPPEESPNTKPKALTVKEDEAKLVAKIAQRFKKLDK
jgi:hypothetical protein